ncbi:MULTISPECIES: YqkE family protein [Paenibacillus]|jgi:predicted lipid-binding transport protein (Tim44 family)|uniref:YqkE family protein n=2 Tax=Paenibacillus TaxID=44249 RepID=A0AAJ3MGW0_PAEPO|nr:MULTISPECIES: YqkE family protein [Paenibacillus]MCF2717670.1 YqkE family protein [Paenibacillus sp. UKAQ_18]AHC18690.1 hypothetical protein X809_05245 [Paenibacillus polymyxa CR1]ALA40979.1 hypothetical protein ABE82_05350 [Paenibacillus peoriae]AOK91559.1 hypothetical protein AOU00_18145 [Paenibacillus polymyxa]APB72317.1 DUF3886 domain-containing protein [Paenibacillus polymyxa]
MAKKRNSSSPAPAAQDKPATLKDLLSQDVLNKLKAQANEAQAEQDKRKEDERQRAVEAKKAEQKKLDNNFEHLLNNSNLDWHKYK